MSVLLRSRPGVLLVLLVLVVGGLGITSSGAEASPPNAPATPATPAAPAAPVEMTAPSARGNPDRDFASMPRACRSRVEPSKICRVTRFKKRPWIVLWGDSHALQYLSPVTAVARNRRVNLVAIYSGGCPLSLPFPAGSDEPRLACDHHNVRAWEYVRDLASSKRRVRVVLGSYWHYYRTAWERLQEEERNGVAPEDS
uniref:SGNH hydrolase domain-containing protein n=1 Tax=Nocardioides sp. TaxID=35761 RepID=UPI002B26FAE3